MRTKYIRDRPHVQLYNNTKIRMTKWESLWFVDYPLTANWTLWSLHLAFPYRIFIHISLSMLSKALRPLTNFLPTHSHPFYNRGPLPYLHLPSYSFKMSKDERLRKQQSATTARQSYIGKRSVYLNLALTCFVFAVCFAGIPLYRTFCEHMGLVGDLDKKTYDFKGKKILNQKKYKVIFEGIAQPGIDW